MTSPVAENLTLSDFDFDLPESLIAQEPSMRRDCSRLLAVDRASGSITHCIFAELEQYLVPGDLLVLNDTKVFPCRLLAKKPGGGRAEIFLLSEQGVNLWEALVKGGVGEGKRLSITAGIEAEITGEGADNVRTVRFHGINDIRIALPEIGKTPLPPYIKRDADNADRERYQTVYAAREGAVAAPTAGLHFTRELLQRLETKGIQLAMVTLHVGPGTFLPVRVERITDHRMLPERYSITGDAAARINLAKAEGRRVIAVGTTSVRTIETAAAGGSRVAPGEGSSELFIYPGYQFTVTDGLVTNFHLPKSTLLMLVSAFAGRERTLSAYRTAVAEKYRFYSYGDAMAIL
ncbi:MAG: tRNA preQ1(34) S-adenosylmethionine ribosyltransferase-isomerase QueA [Nitrospirae bacterium]|nr:tRNA preQ1(34) S-adenosylmethionine ribosyltransferase-isomerase QueA [Nitrospirota bacterium]